jgi:hypothetical protein
MNKDELNNEYFDWMCQIVGSDKYRKLLYLLHNIEFTYLIDMDSNRYEDGTDLRYRFCYENDLDSSMISEYLDNRPCSVLEMLIALSVRIEESIMHDQEVGDRTGQWFWGMIKNLGLGSMDDSHFRKRYTENIIQRFLDRTYEHNGKGGLFTIEDCKTDLRNVEIWYQACWYLDTVMQEV